LTAEQAFHLQSLFDSRDPLMVATFEDYASHQSRDRLTANLLKVAAAR